MSNTIPGLLNNTLNLVTLARETALVLGKENQANKLTPVVEELRTVVSTAKNPSISTEPNGILAQSDFQTLLSAAQKTTPTDRNIPTLGISERNMIVKAMAEGSMPDVDIARQLGMTRDEVNLVINTGKASATNVEVRK
jgi:hypothetical protein